MEKMMKYPKVLVVLARLAEQVLHTDEDEINEIVIEAYKEIEQIINEVVERVILWKR